MKITAKTKAAGNMCVHGFTVFRRFFPENQNGAGLAELEIEKHSKPDSDQHVIG